MSKAPHTPMPAPNEDEIDIRDLFRILWTGKWVIGAVTSAVTAIAVIVALMLPDIYRSEALLAPNDQEGASSLSSLAAQYGGLASLAGINLGGSGDKTALGLETLKSRQFIYEFIERRDILVPLMAADGWNSNTDKLEIDASIYDVDNGKWVRSVSPPRAAVPSMHEAYKVFMDSLSINQDKKTGFVTIAIEHYSPRLARQWVDWLVADLNSSIMHKDVTEAEQAIEYLKEQVASTSIADLQSVFFRLIEEKTKVVMLAKVSDEYLLKTVDPAVVPEERARPRRALMVVASAVLSALVTMLLVLLVGDKGYKEE